MRARTPCLCLLMVVLGLTGCSTVYMKGTPFYTGEDRKMTILAEDRVNLWPLLYYSKPSFSMLWPLVEVTDDHIAARPLFSVYKLDKLSHQWNALASLAQFDLDTKDHRIFPFFWGKQGGDSYFVTFPEVWWFKDLKGVVPVFWWDNGFTVFPVAWYETNGKFCHLFPLWLYTKKPGGQNAYLLWPIFQWNKTERETGFRVWPLVGAYKGQNSRYRYALWPLVHDYRDSSKTDRVAFPLYFEHTDSAKRWWLLVPLVFHGKGNNGSLTLTPLWSGGSSKGSRWNAVFPLYYYMADQIKGDRLLTPIAGRVRSPDTTRWFVFPLASSVAWGKGEKDVWALAPLIRARWGGEHFQHHVLPIYYYSRNDKVFLSPLVGWKNDPESGFVSILTLLALHEWNRGEKTFHLVPPLTTFKWAKDKSLRKAEVVPLFSWHKSGDATTLWVVPWLYSMKSAYAARSSLFPLWNYKRSSDPKSERRETDFALLWPLYDYQSRTGRTAKDKTDQAKDYLRSRILWQMMHYERMDSDRSLDMFPFITWDRRADGSRQFSFMWRLYRNRRTAEGKHDVDALFIPLARAK